ncbi:exopolysaccharide production repressor protein [Mesorhizobium abyssinicae]|uniref:exopolysaccharide production repressor protein n=1 Tax=Mesorhizobium abyssinicae TaxID=1209958 RepID=UPI00339721BE
MYFPRFLVGATAVLVIFLMTIYIMTGSIRYSLIWAAVAALVLQAGYFLNVIYLVIRGDAVQRDKMPIANEERPNLLDLFGFFSSDMTI